MYEALIGGHKIVIRQSAGLFSPNAPDAGTRAMLSKVELAPGMKLLDLGCGTGIVGIYASLALGEENVVMCDIDPTAVAAAKENARMNGVAPRVYLSDALESVPESGFDLILTNPPYQSDFSVAKRFIEKGFNRLKPGGYMYMVTKRRDWYFNKLKSVFGGAKVYETDGYFVFEAQKRDVKYAYKKR